MRLEGKIRIAVSSVIMMILAYFATSYLYEFYQLGIKHFLVDTSDINDIIIDGSDFTPVFKLLGGGFNGILLVIITGVYAVIILIVGLILLIPFRLIGLNKKRCIEKLEYKIVKCAYVIILTLSFLIGGILTRFSFLILLFLLNAIWGLLVLTFCVVPLKMHKSTSLGESVIHRQSVKCVTYTNSDKEIVKKGITAIREVLMGEDADKKRSLLFCLEWFMDPYFGQDISKIKGDLVELLQTVVISNNEIEVKEDALQLLGDYTWGPYKILEENYGKIEECLKSDADYVINLHRISKIDQLMIKECIRIYEEIRMDFDKMADKVWIIYNSNLSETEESKPEIESTWLFENGEINNLARYPGSKFSLLNEQGFFINPEMHFNILLNENKVILTYYFGKRFARCFIYDLVCLNENYKIENPQVIWVI